MQITEDSLNNIRREVSKHFRNKKSEDLKDKIDEFATKSMNKSVTNLYRGINDQPRINLVKDENDDLIADCNDVENMWKNSFCRLLNVFSVSDGRQMERETVERLLAGPNPFEVEITIAR
jgi:hypothetical protein